MKEVEVVEFVVVILVETGFELLLFIEPEIVKKSMNGAKKEMLSSVAGVRNETGDDHLFIGKIKFYFSSQLLGP